MTYTKIIDEFIKVRLEQTPNKTQIARDVKNKFNLDNIEVEAVRKHVRNIQSKLKIKAKEIPIKRLFFDIETSYYTCRLWSIGKVNYVSPETIKDQKQIICIAYKWQYEETVHILDWSMGEKKMLKEFIKVLGQADEIIAHNGDKFDIKELRTRCISHGVLMFPQYRTLDTLKKSRQYFKFASNKLDYIGQYLNVGRKLEHEGFQLWIDVVEKNKKESLRKMLDYCKQDVILLEDVYFVLSPYIDHNNNFAVLTGGEKWDCPECASKKVKMHRTYTTAMGIIRRKMKCGNCKKEYKISNRNYIHMLEHENRINKK